MRQKHDNPQDNKFVLLVGSICMMCFLLGAVGFFVKGGSVVVLLGMTLIGAVFLIGIWGREYVHRPRSIVVEEDGVRLAFRYSLERYVPWDEIKWIDALPGDNTSTIGRWQRDGMMQLKKGLPFPLTYEVAHTIVQAYAKYKGRNPPTSRDARLPR